MKTKMQWTACDTSNANYLGSVEFQDKAGEWHAFELLYNTDRIIFGGACNAGFLESGFMRFNEGEWLEDALSELMAELETYYNNGADYVSRIVCNERM